MEQYVTVSQITTYISNKFRLDDNLQEVYVKGEISNYRTYPNGHSYFTLKDSESQINSVMFKNYKSYLNFEPKDGMKVIIKGRIEVYKKNGVYQLHASRIIEDGVGDLHIAFEQLKKKLEKEGLFDKSHKKEIPKYPEKIGVVTAKTGAAVRDIITTIQRRYPMCKILVFSTLVQGDLAKYNIVEQIKHAQKFNLDTLIVGRGGGSIEDLWPFNEEEVARAIYECEIPVISAVGHEIDYTISDFVADKRAPTPTAAAEFAVPDIIELEYKINHLKARLENSINDTITQNKLKLEQISKKQVLKSPEGMYNIKRMQLDNLIGRFNSSSNTIITDNKNRLARLENSIVLKHPETITKNKKEKFIRNIAKLEVLNPLLTLKRGYTITKKDDKVISSSKDVEVEDKLTIEFEDGMINTKVI